MKIDLNFSFFFCFVLVYSVFCDDFKCPARGEVSALKVPNVLSLIDKQTGYKTSVEIISPTGGDLVNEYNDLLNKVSFIDMEATIQDEINRRYYYHIKNEKIVVSKNLCSRFALSQEEKMNAIKDWFRPTRIVTSSEIFSGFDYLGPTILMIYANKISDKASFVGSELIEGRSVNHWFYCIDPNGPYIDFYFDVKTSLPYRFSLYYPEWIETQEIISSNETRTVKKQVDSQSKYIYNYFKFKPLVISEADIIPYPVGYGCPDIDTFAVNSLPNFAKVKEFTMDMEAIITYPNRDPFKSTARVMKHGDIISYEIREGEDFVRSIEMPPPLGRFQVEEHTGQCYYHALDHHSSGDTIVNRWPYDSYDDTLVTRWPFHQDLGFNLLYYLVMKPDIKQVPTFISGIHLGPLFVQEYRASGFFTNAIDAIIDYYFTYNTSTSIPSKVVFAPDRSNKYYVHYNVPTQVEVKIINYETSNIDHEDRFDVSGCYQEPGNFTWFQLLFSNPWLSEYDMEAIKEQTEKYLTSFIPITRIGPIHAQEVDSNIYVTVKLYDRVHFIDAYKQQPRYTIMNPSNVVKRIKAEDCEQLCSANPNCNDFSYCDDNDCSFYVEADFSIQVFGYFSKPSLDYKLGCVHYSFKSEKAITPFVDKNYLSTMDHVLQQIRNKVSTGVFELIESGLSAVDLRVVNGPEDIGDISQELRSSDSLALLRTEDFPIIKTDRHFNKALFKIEKGTLNDCFMACLNNDDCNTISYCIDKNKECILSRETSDSLKENKTSHADGCNIYQKSSINLFHEYPGKNLVLDAISTLSDISVGDCAKTCAQSDSFKCESFDYCKVNYQRNTSLCFLHINHIELDKTHEINVSNWKDAESGCTHYSRKSELDYERKVGLALKNSAKEAIVGTFDHLSLENCASKCNLDPNCFTLEFCESIDYKQISDRSASLSSCSLTNLKPSKIDQSELFEQSKGDKKICSIYVNHMKITGKSKTDPQVKVSTKSDNFSLVIGLSTVVFVLAFAGGFIGFKFAVNKRLIP